MSGIDHLGKQQFKDMGPRRRRLPMSTVSGPLYHGTTPEDADAIHEHGFDSTHANSRHSGAIFLTRSREHAGLHGSAVVQVDGVRGVSGHETGYLNHDLAREAGADYMDHQAEIAVLTPRSIFGARRVS